MNRDQALEIAQARLFALRALPWEELVRRADAGVVRQEEAGSGELHCRFIITRYAWVEGEEAVRVTVNVEDGGWPVLDEDVEFVRFD